MIGVIDLLIILSAALSAWFWWKASGRRLRRVERNEELDSRDLNRIIVAINRSQILNARAAISTAVSAALIALHYLMSFLGLL
ncbi:hypothetical protein [Dongia sp.]|uniref:hypothetical protein n=1 Tax=Dongia sp. TaxID=1977262 RepID=UPI0035B0E760